jgi:hypothetical protein
MSLRARGAWLALGCALAFNPLAFAHDRDDDFRIETLSTKPHLVSGGDVLVRVTLPERLDRHDVRVELNGRNITHAFHAESKHTLVGLVNDLKLGRNEIEVSKKRRGRAERLVVTNWPLSGPITSGPHQDPFICQTHQFLLPDGTPYTATPAAEPDCSAPTRITYMYMPVGGSALVPLPGTTPLPANVAMTTTTTGQTVRFIVRVETSTVDRGIYQSAVLHDPTLDAAPSPFSPPRGWNRRLIAVEGFGCPGGWYVQGAAIGSLAFSGMDFALLSPARLGEGYAMFSNTLQHPSNNCNSVLAGEAAMMSKERFIETYGVPRYTVSAGCSGGSYGSIQLADQLPGLFDGALIACTFPDPLSIALSGSDGHLLANYFAANPAALTNAQKTAITGYKFSGPDGQLAFIDAARQSGRTDPVAGRVSPGIPGYVSAPFNANVPVAERYHPVTNPRGARGTVYDAARNVYGVDGRTGFALRPFDNVGVQYGLKALNDGVITPKQFLDLNEGVGGFDQDANPVAARSMGSTGAIRRAYQSGLQFVGSGGLASIPLVDISGIYNDDAGYHYQWFHFATRDRMEQANGDTRNHVMWRGNVPFDAVWSMFIAWVEAVASDERHGSARDKVARNRPGNAVDGCWPTTTEFVAERQSFGSTPDSTCNTLFPSFAFPRYVAGGPLAANILKCRLERVDRRDYDVAFSAAEFERLKRIFPDGVCDWSKRGVGQTEVVEWGSFGPSRENLVFDVTD